MQMKYKIIFTSPFILIILGIFFLSNQSTLPPELNSFNYEDKLLHIIAYFILGVSLIFAILINFPNFNKKNIIITLLIIGAVYAITDEIHQIYVPGRCAEIYDLFADLFGILLSQLLIFPIRNMLFSKYIIINKNNEKTTN